MTVAVETTTTVTEIRSGAYYDSVVLMQLQRALSDQPNILDAGVVMGTPANKELLAQSGLLTNDVQQAAPEDLILVVRGASAQAAQSALAQVDALLATRRSQAATTYRPKTLHSAVQMVPAAEWVLISVPGRYAAQVAGQALDLGKNVFLYSDNVSLEDEIQLKSKAAEKNLLLMGPDCGTAIIDGVGLGFANRVRRGTIGVVAASGTGLQAVTVGIHRLGGGISQAYGTGGRDLSAAVQAATAKQALARLANDPQTDVILLVSKPPSPAVAQALLAEAVASGKPVVVNFIGFGEEASNPDPQWGGDAKGGQRVHFAQTLDQAAELAVALTTKDSQPDSSPFAIRHSPFADRHSPASHFLRGLYAGGTLAYEALFLLQAQLPDVRSNAPLPGGPRLANPHRSEGHTIVDLGGDEFTVGRLHPMLDNELRIRRLLEEAKDPSTGLILLDVVLGDGAHPDPASELAPAITEAIRLAESGGRRLPVVAVVIGTDLDPQGLDEQIQRLEDAGATVFTRHDVAVQAAIALLGDDPKKSQKDDILLSAADQQKTIHKSSATQHASRITQHPSRNTQHAQFSAINIGLESFTESLRSQGAEVIHVDWRPPAGGNEKLAGILERMRGNKT